MSAARAPLTLRRQLVLVVVGLLVVVLAVIGTISVLALRGSLSRQLDDQLHAAAQRAANFPGRWAAGGATTGGTAGGTAGETGATPRPRPTPTTADGTVCPDVDTALPGGSVAPPGQGAGQVGVQYRRGVLVDAGYYDDAGCYVALDTAQTAALQAVPADGAVHAVSLPDLGSYRAIASAADDGTPLAVTALPTRAMDATVRQFVLVEVALALLAVLAAWLVGSTLVRRSLAPLDRVTAVAEHVSQAPLDRGEVQGLTRVGAADTDERTEVGTVGAAFNRMLDNVEGSLAARQRSETQVRQFVADASHELRTPLASIRGYAELVRRSPEALPDGAARALDRIESEGVRLGALVDDLLLLARLDAGRPLDRAPVDLTALAIDAVADAHAAAPDHSYVLDLPDVPDDGPDDGLADSPDDGDGAAGDLTAVGDEARLRQLLTNLVGNARVHTPPGTRVTVGVRGEPDAVVLTVADDGPGIDPALVPSLFQRFSRGDTARNRVGGSTGLGLAIAHAVVAAHHGTIEVSSTVAAPSGTTFTVRLPRA